MSEEGRRRAVQGISRTGMETASGACGTPGKRSVAGQQVSKEGSWHSAFARGSATTRRHAARPDSGTAPRFAGAQGRSHARARQRRSG